MSKDWESIYLRLGALAATMPALDGEHPPSNDDLSWLGRVQAVLDNMIDGATDIAAATEAIGFKSSCDNLANQIMARDAAHMVRAAFYRALARAETKAPAPMQGAFIVAGNALDAVAAFTKIFGAAKKDVLIVDPYADVKAVLQYAVLAPETIRVRIFADDYYKKPTLKVGVDSWRKQFPARPIEARLSPPKSLHDRLICLDDSIVYAMGQSLNAFAERAPTSILKVDPQIADLKMDAYHAIWNASTAM